MNRLERLKELQDTLYWAIKECDSKRDLAALSKQYRETIKEIEEIEGKDSGGDEVGDILEEREANGKSGAVR